MVKVRLVNGSYSAYLNLEYLQRVSWGKIKWQTESKGAPIYIMYLFVVAMGSHGQNMVAV